MDTQKKTEQKQKMERVERESSTELEEKKVGRLGHFVDEEKR